MTKRRKPHNPAAETELQLARLEIARLQNLGAEVNIDTKTGKILSARRSNVFNLLLAFAVDFHKLRRLECLPKGFPFRPKLQVRGQL